MRWTIRDNTPPLAGRGVRIYCDDELVPRVIAFDTDEGWIEAHCLDGHTGHAGRPHLDPNHPDQVCVRVLRGKVDFRVPEIT